MSGEGECQNAGPHRVGPARPPAAGGSWAPSPPFLPQRPGTEEAGPQDPKPGGGAGLPGGRAAGTDKRHQRKPQEHLHSPGHPRLGSRQDGLAPGHPDRDGECCAGPRILSGWGRGGRR